MLKKTIVSITLITLTSCVSHKIERPTIVVNNEMEHIINYLTEIIGYRLKKDNISGLSIALVKNQEIVWGKGFGYANKKKKIPTTEYTQYRAGSISKLFTATAVMQQAEQGTLNLDAPLNKAIPELAIKTRFTQNEFITLRNILTHHSGLPTNYINHNPNAQASLKTIVNNANTLWAKYPVNTVFSYSNLGYALAGVALENATRQSFDEHMNLSLLPQLGMTQSKFSATPHHGLALAYNTKGKLTRERTIRNTPAGGLETNVIELSNLIKMVNGDGVFGAQRILSPQALEQMLKVYNRNVSFDIGVKNGLGWFIHEDIVNETVIGHDGATYAHRSLLLVNKTNKLGVVILSNSANANDLNYDLASEAIILMTAATKGIAPPQASAKQRPYVAQNSININNATGTYASILGKLDILNKNGKLSAKIAGKKLNIKQQDHTSFSINYKLFGFIPIRLGKASKARFYIDKINGIDTIIGELYGQKMRLATKVEATPISQAWLNRAGVYHIKENPNLGELYPISKIKIDIQKNFLTAKVFVEGRNKIEVILTPLDDKKAYIAGYGRYLGETIEFTEDGFSSLGVDYILSPK